MPGRRRKPNRFASRFGSLVVVTFSFVARCSAQKHLGILPNGQPTCRDGVWTEHSEQDVIDANVMPDVQCWRNPPSIRSTYLTPEKCARWPNDDDWPTWDPHHPVTPEMKRCGDVIRDFFREKTVIFVGDSINLLVHNAFMCDAARDGFMPMDPKSGSDSAVLREAAFNGKAFWEPTDWVGGPPGQIQMLSKTETIVSRKGWHHYGAQDMATLLALADIIVVNYALHYTQGLDHYEREMRKMFEQVADFAKTPGKAFIFRETGAEHKHIYDDEEEKLLPEDERYLGCRCRIQAQWDAHIAQHNAVIEKLRAECAQRPACRYPQVTLAPFFNLTQPAADLHEQSWCTWSVVTAERDNPRPVGEKEPFCCDCTHYGYYPQLWQHFWHGLWHALVEAPGMPKPARGRSEQSLTFPPRRRPTAASGVALSQICSETWQRRVQQRLRAAAGGGGGMAGNRHYHVATSTPEA